MTKNEYNEMLEELISNCKSEIRINNESYKDNEEITNKAIKESISYVLDNSNILVNDFDIELTE